jgi:phosphoribosylformylglycinamidine (FGAM) synthase-like enzyme
MSFSSADPLRFGNQTESTKERVKYIANSVVDGIAGYGNPIEFQ